MARSPDAATVLLAEVTSRGIQLRSEDGRLWYKPRSAMTPELAERLRANRDELVSVLGPGDSSGVRRPEDLPAYWRRLFEERAAIMEYDGHMTRADAEELARADIKRLMGEA